MFNIENQKSFIFLKALTLFYGVLQVNLWYDGSLGVEQVEQVERAARSQVLYQSETGVVNDPGFNGYFMSSLCNIG